MRLIIAALLKKDLAQGSHEAAFLLRTSKVDHDARYGGNSREREES
jgi:hypothetical protein